MYGWGSVGKAGQIEYCVRVLSRVTGTTTQQSSEDHADRVRGPIEHREPPKCGVEGVEGYTDADTNADTATDAKTDTDTARHNGSQKRT